MTFNPKVCEDRKENCRRELDAVWKRFEADEQTNKDRMNGFDKKLWILVIVGLTQLATFAAALILAWGKSIMVY